MAKPTTKAVLTLVDIIGKRATVSTTGTRPAPGTRLSNWNLDWADGSKENGKDTPPIDFQHDYIADGDYKTTFTVVDTKGKSSLVNLMLIVRNPTVTVPTAPSTLVTTLISNNQINMTWTDNSNNETGFEVQCQIDGGSFFNRIQLPQNTTSFQDLQVQPNHTYTYRVRAFNSGGFSSFSNSSSQTTGVATYNYIVALSINGGNDANPGTLAQPFATIKHALEVASANLTGTGKVIGVRGQGNYSQSIIDPVAAGNSSVNSLRVINYNGETVNIVSTVGDKAVWFTNGQAYIDFDGINFDNSNQADKVISIDAPVNAPHHIRFMNASVTGIDDTSVSFSGNIVDGGHDNSYINLLIHGHGLGYAFYLQGDDMLVDGCEVYDVNLGGGQSWHESGAAPNRHTVRNSIFRDIVTSVKFGSPFGGMWGWLFHGDGHLAYNNVFWNVGVVSADTNYVLVAFGATNTKFWNNTIADNPLTNVMQIDSGSSNCEAVNTIAWNNKNTAVVDSGTFTVKVNNSWQSPVNGANHLLLVRDRVPLLHFLVRIKMGL
jgi:fibronectin type III domain protein